MYVLVYYIAESDVVTDADIVKSIVVKCNEIKFDSELGLIYIGEQTLIPSRFVKAEILSVG